MERDQPGRMVFSVNSTCEELPRIFSSAFLTMLVASWQQAPVKKESNNIVNIIRMKYRQPLNTL